MSITRFSGLILFVVVIGVLLIVLPGRHVDSPVEVEDTASEETEDSGVARKPRAEVRQASRSLNQQPDCTPWSMIDRSPDAYLVDEWYSTWGAPPSFSLELASRPYAHYSESDLKSLAESGDAVAMHELGQSLIWSALRDNERMPDVETLWEIGSEKYPYATRPDFDQLERGRELLYRAAVTGRLYALIEISLSFTHQHAVEVELARLGDDQLQALQVEAYAYGEAMEQLVTGMPSSFFQAQPPNGLVDIADSRLAEVVERIIADRAVEGLDNTTLPRVDHDLLKSLNLCVK